MCRYYNVIFTFYGLQEVNTAALADKKERTNITNISFYSRVVDFGSETYCFSKISFDHARFPVNFYSRWSFE